MQLFINIDSQILAELANESIAFPSFSRPIMRLVYFLQQIVFTFNVYALVLPPFISSLLYNQSFSFGACLYATTHQTGVRVIEHPRHVLQEGTSSKTTKKKALK